MFSRCTVDKCLGKQNSQRNHPILDRPYTCKRLKANTFRSVTILPYSDPLCMLNACKLLYNSSPLIVSETTVICLCLPFLLPFLVILYVTFFSLFSGDVPILCSNVVYG